MSMTARIGVLVAALITLAASMNAQTAPPAKPAVQTATPAGKVENGGVLYKKVGCYQCHANEAQGGLSGPRIGPGMVPYARFSQVHP